MDGTLPNFSWIRQGRVAGMACPPPDCWRTLAEAGVRALLSLTERPIGAPPAGADLALAHVPLLDFGAPSLDELERCVAWIEERLAEARPVAVHCRAGVGRTGTVLAAWLVHDGLGPGDAIAEVRRLRPGSVETPGQERSVHAFARRREVR